MAPRGIANPNPYPGGPHTRQTSFDLPYIRLVATETKKMSRVSLRKTTPWR